MVWRATMNNLGIFLSAATALFIVTFAHESPQNNYENCRIPNTTNISALHQRALSDREKPARQDIWMCFGSSRSQKHERENSDNIGGLENKTIVAAYRIDSPYVMLEEDREGKQKLAGYFIDFWKRMEKKLKFRTKYIGVDHYLKARDRLAMADVDVLLLPIVSTIEDHDNFQFTLPVASHWYTLFLRRARVAVAPDAHIRAMGSKMILLSAGLLFLLIASLWISESIGRWIQNDTEYRLKYAVVRKRPVAHGGSNPESSLRRFLRSFAVVTPGNCCLCVVGTLCAQNWNGVSKRLPTRILLVSSAIFGFLVINSYGAVLMSFLTAGSRDVPSLAHLDDIAKQGDTVLCVRRHTHAYARFLQYPEGPVQPLWRNVLNSRPCPANPETTEELLHALCKDEGTVLERYTDTDPRVGILEVPGVMAATLEQPPEAHSGPRRSEPFNKCQLVRMRRRHVVNMISLMLRRGFPHTTELNIEILRNRAAGLIAHLEIKWMGRDRLVHHAPLWDGSLFKPLPTSQVSLLHIRTLLHAFATSLLIPVFILLCEIIFWNAPWRYFVRKIYHPDIIQKGEGLSGPPARAIVPNLTANLRRNRIIGK